MVSIWISDFLTKERGKTNEAQLGNITQTNTVGLSAVTSLEQRQLPTVGAYGVAYVPPVGEKCVVLPLENGGVCLGTIAKRFNLSPGEIMLYSKGGASIVLKNSGEVLINGKVFEVNS